MLIRTFGYKFVFKVKIFFLPQSQNIGNFGELNTIVTYNISLQRSSFKEQTLKPTFEVEPGCYKAFGVVVFLGWALEGLVDSWTMDILTQFKIHTRNQTSWCIRCLWCNQESNYTLLQPRVLDEHLHNFKSSSSCGLWFTSFSLA